MEPFFTTQLLKVFLEVQQGAEQQYDDVLMTCQVCSSNFPIQKLHFCSQILDIKRNRLYPVFETQNSKRSRQSRTNL